MDNFIDRFSQRKSAQEMIRANAMAEAEEKAKMTMRLSEYEMAMQELRRCNLLNLESAEKVKELLSTGLSKIEEVQKKDRGSAERPEKTVEEVRNLLESLKSQMAELQEKQQRQTAELLGKQQGRTAEILEGQQRQTAELLEKQQGRMMELLAEQKNQMAELLREQSARLENQNAGTEELTDSQKKAIEELLHNTEEFNHKEAVKVYRNVQAVIDGALPKQTEEITQAVSAMTERGKMPAWLVAVWVLTFLAAAGNIVIEVLKILGYL